MKDDTLTLTIPAATLVALAEGWCTAHVELANEENLLAERFGIGRVILESAEGRVVRIVAEATPGADGGGCRDCP